MHESRAMLLACDTVTYWSSLAVLTSALKAAEDGSICAFWRREGLWREFVARERWLEMEIENPEEASGEYGEGGEKEDAASRLDGSRGMLQKRIM